jgi:two-component system, LytTR family, response regulator AlgR
MDDAALSVLIVDDEALARARLRLLVEACAQPRCQVVGEAADANAALAQLRAQPADLVLLDIAMPGMSGLDLADALRELPRPPAVVFVTAHGEHALHAFELEALDYLTKPVRRERLVASLQRAAQRRAPTAAPADAGAPAAPPVLVVSDRGRVLRIPLAEVTYLKAEQKYVTLHATQGEWVLDESLNDLEQRLGEGFIRVHRNAVVALHAVRLLERRAIDGEGDDEGAEGWAVQVQGGEWLAVSRRQVAAVREAVSRVQRQA